MTSNFFCNNIRFEVIIQHVTFKLWSRFKSQFISYVSELIEGMCAFQISLVIIAKIAIEQNKLLLLVNLSAICHPLTIHLFLFSQSLALICYSFIVIVINGFN